MAAHINYDEKKDNMRSWARISWVRLGLGFLRQALVITLTNYTVSDPTSSTVKNEKKIICHLCCSYKFRALQSHHQGGIYKGTQCVCQKCTCVELKHNNVN